MSTHKRNAKAVLAQLVENATGQVLCKVPCKIQIPERYIERGLGEAGINTFAFGVFPIILETGEYAVMNICALVELNPFKVTPIEIDGTAYIEFYFQANTVVIKTTTVVRRKTLMFNVFDEFIFKGKVPWFMNYEDIGKLFDTANSHGDSNVGTNLETIELLASMITRSSSDKNKYIRTVAKTYADVDPSKTIVIPMTSIFYAVNSTTNKIAGNYFSEGVISALVKPSVEVGASEAILRA